MLKKTDTIKDTEKTYSLLWRQKNTKLPPQRWHFNIMQEVVTEPIVRGQIGIEIGSGRGYDTYIMAKNNPTVKFTAIDISDGIYNTARIVSGLKNVSAIKSSSLEIPIKDEVFDFAYSYGVLHHTPDPKKGLSEIVRILKKGSPAFLYLYEDHSENLFKYISVKIISWIRVITTKIPRRLLYYLSWIASPFPFLIFTLPAKALKRFSSTKYIAARIPFNFGRGPFSLQADLYDRFGAPIEHRFSRQEIYDMFSACGLRDIRIRRLQAIAGWVAWGYKET